MKRIYYWLIAAFVVAYSFFVLFVDLQAEVAGEIILASVFFFALFAGFFITRQSERYSKVAETIAETDGLFSYLYRVSGLVPRIQDQVREIIRAHYQKILHSKDWAYHVLHPSTTLTQLTETFGTLRDSEGKQPRISTTYETIWDTIMQLQVLRKKIIILYNERIVLFQWVLLYILALILIVSFDLISSTTVIIDVMKIFFGATVFLALILLKQLNGLTLFGKDFSERAARDVLRILEETDRQVIEGEKKKK